ncbi:MAG: glycosyltransferase [Candidatus Omnitrophica bacterium]|nr:glycosyltransferase [Candidatus Omnitrophota bacterium]
MRKPGTSCAEEILLPGLSLEESAALRLTAKQGGWLLGGIAGFLYLVSRYPWGVLFFLNASVTIFYLVLTIYKILLIWPAEDEKISQPKMPQPEQWPTYTVLVPLYQEAKVVNQIISALNNLDYPSECLDIKLLLEEDDTATIEAVEKIALGPPYQVILLSPCHPRTKPKACNEGLKQARGEYLVIYDAEDKPEPDQLKRAVLAFAQASPLVACFQAKLNFYNASQNLLTAWFAAEYSAWFDLYLPGLARLDAPIPLGGTSNHFRVDVLRTVGGWDPYNVAEDCDLGIRLYRRGWRTRILDSTTWEEACGHLSQWWKQRSRWVKGYLQTYLVHLRHPITSLRQLGWQKTFHFHLMVGGLLLCLLVNPVYWGLTIFWLITRSQLLNQFFPPAIFFLSAFCLFVGNFVFAYTCGLAVFRRHDDRLVKAALFTPPYWLLMSLASWKGFWQFLFKPFHWEKTAHGLFTPGVQS